MLHAVHVSYLPIELTAERKWIWSRNEIVQKRDAEPEILDAQDLRHQQKTKHCELKAYTPVVAESIAWKLEP